MFVHRVCQVHAAGGRAELAGERDRGRVQLRPSHVGDGQVRAAFPPLLREGNDKKVSILCNKYVVQDMIHY